MSSSNQYLAHIAYQIRRLAITSTTQAGSGHPTSCLSAADILAVIFFDTLTPKDDFILSKGHAAPALYAVYALLGCMPEEELMTLRQLNSPLEGHPTPRFPYISVATGSLGQGLSVGVGQLLAARLRGDSQKRCFVLMGDSETAEGSVWEAIELAAFYKINNLVAIIDANGLGQTTRTLDNAQTYKKKFESFGWNAHIVQGNSIEELKKLLATLDFNAPTCIIAQTVKGFGLPSIQNKENFHGKAFDKNDATDRLYELEKTFPTDASFKPAPLKKSDLCGKVASQNFLSIIFKKPHFEKNDMIATRKAYGDALAYLGSLSPDVVVFDAEVNNSTYASYFAQAYPSRFFQAFIAEQNMIGMATGSATQGLIPFSSTFAAFLTRAHDQLRMAAISKIALRVVGSHCGVSIGPDGPSQMGLEDIALFRTLPDAIILYPCDAVSTYRCVEIMAGYHTGISYLRTTRADTPVMYDNDTRFSLGDCQIIKQQVNDTATVVTAGITIFEALKAYELLQENNISFTLIDCYSIQPLPIKKIIAAAQKTDYRLIIVEDHYTAGGLGEAVMAACMQHAPGKPWYFKHLAVRKLPMSGLPHELLGYEDIDAHALYTAVQSLIA